ncbi:MAG: hypothetical protein M3Q75_01035 [Gemmatimonadota bacterium]|nr:hypothetical protein [Gemmatimonadota bacterium]
MSGPTVTNLRKHAGIAGQFQVSATVTYPGEDPNTLAFVGSVYGGPVVMVTDAGQTFVTDPGRFGEFGTAWLVRFIGATS